MDVELNNESDAFDVIRIKLPDKIHIGDIIEIRTLIKHPMETGLMKEASGKLIPKNIIKSLKILFANKTFFTAEFGTGISENPFISCHMKVNESGELLFIWEDDQGKEWSKKILVNVA